MESVVISLMLGALLTLHLSQLSPQPKFSAVTGCGMTLSVASMLAGQLLLSALLCLFSGWVFYLSAASFRGWQAQQKKKITER